MEEKCFGPIRFVPGANRGKYPYCHSIYIEGAGVLIDPASDRERLMSLRGKPGVKAVWLTHWHEDHFMHLDLFDDVPLSMSREDALPISDIEVFLDWYGIENPGNRAYWRKILCDNFHFRPRKPTRFLEGGQVISLEGLTVEVLSTPGHTPGSLSFFFREPGVLFMGDYDLTPFGPWYGDTTSSIEETIQSVNRLRKIPASLWLTSHETGVFETQPGYLWDRYLSVIATREKKLLDFVQQPRTMEDIVEAWIIYGKPREPRIFYRFGEWSHMKKHLDRLMRAGIVTREGDCFVKVSDPT